MELNSKFKNFNKQFIYYYIFFNFDKIIIDYKKFYYNNFIKAFLKHSIVTRKIFNKI